MAGCGGEEGSRCVQSPGRCGHVGRVPDDKRGAAVSSRVTRAPGQPFLLKATSLSLEQQRGGATDHSDDPLDLALR